MDGKGNQEIVHSCQRCASCSRIGVEFDCHFARCAGNPSDERLANMIPLEDNAADIIGKAQRGLGISDSELGKKRE